MRPRLHQLAITLLLAWIAIALPLADPVGADDNLPSLASDQAGEAVLALLNYNRETCDGIAGKVLDYWRGLGAGPSANLEAAREYVVQRQLSDLAQSREAADLVEKLLPLVREQGDRETTAALERLQALMIQLCDTVAYPKAGLSEFEDELRRMLDRIEQEEAELGRLLIVPAEVLESVLGRFLGRIQLAGVEAEGEYRDYLESLKPPPRVATLQERMDAWHRRYSQAVNPTKQALGKYLQGRKASDTTLIRTACREISAAVIPLLRNDQVFISPVGPLQKPLQRAFIQIKLLGTECGAGRWREVEKHYGDMQTQLAIASGIMAEFSLKP